MKHTIESAINAIMNKWDWENPVNNIPIFLHGPIGIGKTWGVQYVVSRRIIHDLEKKLTTASEEEKNVIEHNLFRLRNYVDPKEVEDLLNEHLLTLRLANFPIEVLQGIPAPSFEQKKALFLMNDMMIRYAKKDWCVIFLDEIDKAVPTILGAATHLIESLRVSDFSFKPDTMIIACANRVTDSFLSNPLPNELLNRAAHLNLSVDIDGWLKFAKKSNLYKDIVRFIEFKSNSGQNFLAMYEDPDSLNYVQAFPTPRTCFICCRQCARLEKAGRSKEEIYDEVHQIVGAKFAYEFRAYKELYETVNVMDILDGKKIIPQASTKRKVVLDGKDVVIEDSVISTQYIYGIALCDQVTPELLDTEFRLKNFIAALQAFKAQIQSVMMKFITSNDKILEKVTTHPDGIKLINDYWTLMEKIAG
jgi:hypothetical protein